MKRLFVGITGASGSCYAQTLLQALSEVGCTVELCVSPAGIKVLRHELAVELETGPERAQASLRAWLGPAAERVRLHAHDAIEAPPSSGSAGIEAVLIVPCSMGTMGRIVAGYSSNLIERAADVALKEGRQLLLLPRETPLSELHLENMLRLVRLGAILLPAMPAFYHRPRSIEDLVGQVVGKILDRLRIESPLTRRWNGPGAPAGEHTEGSTGG